MFHINETEISVKMPLTIDIEEYLLVIQLFCVTFNSKCKIGKNYTI